MSEANTPLFTINNKAVYIGDEYWWIKEWTPQKAIAGGERIDGFEIFILFNTEAEANAWVTENKPVYNLKQMRECWEEAQKPGFSGVFPILKSFEDYIKTITP